MAASKEAKELKKIGDKATKYLSDHILEFDELQDLFCSKAIVKIVGDKKTDIDGGKVYTAVMEAFEEKYKVVFNVIVDAKDIVKKDKNLDYQSLLVTILNDKAISPQELYLLENATKKTDPNKKYEAITNVIGYIDEFTKLSKKKTGPSDKVLEKLRKQYGMKKGQAIQLESYITGE
jgi:hypothetical protein